MPPTSPPRTLRRSPGLTPVLVAVSALLPIACSLVPLAQLRAIDTPATASATDHPLLPPDAVYYKDVLATYSPYRPSGIVLCGPLFGGWSSDGVGNRVIMMQEGYYGAGFDIHVSEDLWSLLPNPLKEQPFHKFVCVTYVNFEVTHIAIPEP